MMDIYEELKNKLDKNNAEPLYKQVSTAISGVIRDGLLKQGDKLPPIRKLAKALQVNNITVVNAYKLLENRKLTYSITGSGTYVTGVGSEISDYNPEIIAAGDNYPEPEEQPNSSIGAINFAKGSVSPELFPVDEFKELFNFVLLRDKGNAFEYGQHQGFPALRKGLCGYLDGFGIKASSEKIQIISGAQQGVDIISKALLYPNDCVLTENPTYYGAVGAFLSRGAQVYGVPLLNDGIDIDKLTCLVNLHRPKLIYVMTYFQTPTCVCYSIEKKRALIELASKYDFYIIEEDNQSDFHYIPNPQIVPLKALDYKNRVIYIKSFSKLLMPGIRLGFMSLPKHVLSRVSNAKHTTDIDTSGFMQRAFSLFIETGGWDKHILKMRGVFKSRYNSLISNANKFLPPYLKFKEPHGGLSVWFDISEKINMTSTELAKTLASGGVIITPGDVFALNDVPFKNVRMSFADINETNISLGIGRLRVLLSQLTENV